MATLKDVAEKAKVTVTTVSRVINNRGYISDETRKKVYQVMKELNYQPNEVARSLSKQRTNTIGIIVPHIDHPYFSKLISNIESTAAKEMFKILLYNSNEETQKEKEYLEMCKSNRVSGIILCSRNVDIKEIMNFDIPVVCIERNLEDGMIGIQCDNYMGGQIATKHLIECGCKNLLHFSGIVNEDMPADARAEGFIQVCNEYNIPYYERKSNIREYTQMEYHAYIEKTLKELPEVDGIFASSDLIAAQVIQVCNKLNIDIPSRIKLVGFDDVYLSSLTTPTITTIRQPIKEMSEWAISLIQKRLKNEMVPDRIKLPVELIKRQTT